VQLPTSTAGTGRAEGAAVPVRPADGGAVNCWLAPARRSGSVWLTSEPLKLSIIIPARNEAATLPTVLANVHAAAPHAQVIVVDDGSSEPVAAGWGPAGQSLQVLRHERNRGKGAAVRTGLAAVSGDLVLIQDADLEYDPADYGRLIACVADPAVDAVFGSRNLRPNPKSSSAFYWGGRAVSWATNLLYGARLTDVTTGYKLVRTALLRDLQLRYDGFEFCPELTGRLLRTGARIVEVPISYRPRTRAEGKKIRARDGFHAVWTLVKVRCQTPAKRPRRDSP
jgi:glycosyltransferase involved in cell wall biosynthesis